jgi:Rrf2 family iron-sulfur cluster assembly transcriptional regulator
MKLTTKGRYAVTAMADLALHGGAEPVSLAEIAARQNISASYLEQLFGKLRRAGLVESARGPTGGYALARPASAMRVSEIIEAADEEIRTTACAPGGVSCQGASDRCLTHDLWEELGRQIGMFLDAVTLEDVIARRVVGTAAVNAPRLSSRGKAIMAGAANE